MTSSLLGSHTGGGLGEWLNVFEPSILTSSFMISETSNPYLTVTSVSNSSGLVLQRKKDCGNPQITSDFWRRRGKQPEGNLKSDEEKSNKQGDVRKKVSNFSVF